MVYLRNNSFTRTVRYLFIVTYKVANFAAETVTRCFEDREDEETQVKNYKKIIWSQFINRFYTMYLQRDQ